MLRLLKGVWRWHRKSEGGHPPSVFLLLHTAVVILNKFIKVIEPVDMAGFCFVRAGVKWSHPSLGSWQ
jgi:hypothetical protein